MSHFLYDQRGSSDKYYYTDFGRALEHLLKDEGYKNLNNYMNELDFEEVEYDYTPGERFFVDDGGPVIELLIPGEDQ